MTQQSVISIVAVLGGLVCAYLIERQNANIRRFAARATSVFGEVVDKWIEQGEDSSVTMISVRFYHDKRPFYFSVASKISIGEPVRVEYDPDEPDFGILAGREPNIVRLRIIIWGWIPLWGLGLKVLLSSD